MSTVLITGINGFLGSNLAKMLSSKFKVIGLEYSLDNLFRLNNTSFKIYSTSSSEWKKLFKENERQSEREYTIVSFVQIS